MEEGRFILEERRKGFKCVCKCVFVYVCVGGKSVWGELEVGKD